MEHMKIFDEEFQNFISAGVRVVDFQNLGIEDNVPEKAADSVEEAEVAKGNLTCSYCKIKFGDPFEQREHYKSDWHRYNLKQSLLTKEPLSEEQFNEKTDLSSISGSETADEADSIDFLASIGGKLFLKNNTGRIFSIYKCLLYSKKVETSEPETLSKELDACCKGNKWCVLMLGGGHFAGAVFEGTNPLLHKTFHCYTVRAGQGGSQSSRDNKSGAGSQPKSAGASLRRYNEQALVQHVNDILHAWKLQIDLCNLIIYRASGPYNRAVLFEGKPPLLTRSDPRLRTVPFSTRRATFAEVKRVHDSLATVHVYSSVEQAIERITRKGNVRVKSKVHRSKSREIEEKLPVAPVESSSSSEDEDLLHNLDKLVALEEFETHDYEVSFQEQLEPFGDSLTPDERKRRHRTPKKSKNKKRKEREERRKLDLRDAVKMADVRRLAEMLKEALEVEGDDDNAKSRFVNQTVDEDGNSLLHLACAFEADEVIKFLLDGDADPCVRNKRQQTAYTCTQSREVREILKQFAKENPEKYNYNKAQIPVVTCTPEELAERKKQQKVIKREKEKKKRQETQVKRKEELEKEQFLMLSDREKRALAAERRLGEETKNRCFLCASDIAGKVPFEYLGNKFCSTECVKAHRAKNPVVLS